MPGRNFNIFRNLSKVPGNCFGKYRGKKQFKLQGSAVEVRERGFRIKHLYAADSEKVYGLWFLFIVVFLRISNLQSSDFL